MTALSDVDTGVLGDAIGVPDNACVNYERCSNTIPGNGEVCAACLDRGKPDG